MIDDDKLERLCDLFDKMVNQYARLEKQVHCFGVDVPLHLSETHTIVAVGKHPNINVISLSRLQGISRSAASQMVSKLARRGFVTKSVSPQTDNEVLLTLTEAGETVYSAHEAQHRWLRGKLSDILEKYPNDTADVLMSIGADIASVWDELQNNSELWEMGAPYEL